MDHRDNPRRYLAFDIEIARPLPQDVDDWKRYRPLGISCAATLSHDADVRLWHGLTDSGEISDQMSQSEVAGLVATLQEAAESGHTLLTWNGLGFDFDILSEESGMKAACQTLALDQVDLMFHVFCKLGHALGLEKAARGMGLPSKWGGMSGEMVPIYWAQGRRQDVLDYVAQDVRITLALAQAAERQGELRWISNQGRPQALPLRGGWLSVRQAMLLPEPDTSWMRNPWKRSKFTEWLEK